MLLQDDTAVDGDDGPLPPARPSLSPAIAIAFAMVALVASAWAVHVSAHPGPISALLGFARGPSHEMDVEAKAASEKTIAGANELFVGADYDFFSEVDGAPVAWSCSRVITVRLAGPYPSAAPWALGKAVSSLAEASGLLLLVGEDTAALVPGGRPRTGEILVSYTGAREVHRLSDSPDAAGVTSTQWDAGTGEILNAMVLIDAGRDAVAPHTGKGFTMLLHELGHSIGLGHAMKGTDEVMDPVTTQGDKGVLGHGDRYALAKVGCG